MKFRNILIHLVDRGYCYEDISEFEEDDLSFVPANCFIQAFDKMEYTKDLDSKYDAVYHLDEKAIELLFTIYPIIMGKI